MVNLLWTKPIRSVSSAPHVRPASRFRCCLAGLSPDQPDVQGGLYRRKGKNWKASCFGTAVARLVRAARGARLPPRAVCPSMLLCLLVAVLFGLVCPWAPPGGGGARAWRWRGCPAAGLYLVRGGGEGEGGRGRRWEGGLVCARAGGRAAAWLVRSVCDRLSVILFTCYLLISLNFLCTSIL